MNNNTTPAMSFDGLIPREPTGAPSLLMMRHPTLPKLDAPLAAGNISNHSQAQYLEEGKLYAVDLPDGSVGAVVKVGGELQILFNENGHTYFLGTPNIQKRIRNFPFNAYLDSTQVRTFFKTFGAFLSIVG